MNPAYKNYNICYRILYGENLITITFNDIEGCAHIYFIYKRKFIPFEKSVKVFVKVLKIYNPKLCNFFNDKDIKDLANILLNHWKYINE